MKKRLLILLITVTTGLSQVWAGGLGVESYLGLGMQIGYGSLVFGGQGRSSSPGGMYGFNVDYSCFINDHVGFTTGIHFDRIGCGYYETAVVSPGEGNVLVSNGVTMMNYNAKYRLVTDRIDETYTSYFVEIPLLVSIQHNRWYWHMGMKLAFPITMEVDYSYGESELYLDEITGSGTVLTNPWHVKTYDGSNGNADLFENEHKPFSMCYVMASFELGYNVAYYSNASSLSLGAFVDMSLNGVKLSNASNSTTMTLNTNVLSYHSIVQTNKVNAVSCFKFGVKLNYNLGVGEKAQRSHRGKRYL